MRIIRELVPGDAGEIERHYLGLDAVDRRRRFCAATSDAAIAQHCVAIDREGSTLLGCFVEGALVAVLSLWPDPRKAEAEFAVSVDKAWQRRGIGRELLQRARILARSAGWQRLTFICLSENRGMRSLARSLTGGQEERCGEVVGAIPAMPSARPQGDVRQRGGRRAVA